MPSCIAPLLQGANRKALLQYIDYLENMIVLYASTEGMKPGHEIAYRMMIHDLTTRAELPAGS